MGDPTSRGSPEFPFGLRVSGGLCRCEKGTPNARNLERKVGMDVSACRSLLNVYVLQDLCMVCLATFTMKIN